MARSLIIWQFFSILPEKNTENAAHELCQKWAEDPDQTSLPCVPGLLMWAFGALCSVFTVCYPVLSSYNVFSWCCFFLACKGSSYITLIRPWYSCAAWAPLSMETENTHPSHTDCISTQFKLKACWVWWHTPLMQTLGKLRYVVGRSLWIQSQPDLQRRPEREPM